MVNLRNDEYIKNGKIVRKSNWILYAIPKDIARDGSIIDLLVNNGFRNEDIEYLEERGNYDIYRVKIYNHIEKNTPIDIISNEFGIDSKRIQIV